MKKAQRIEECGEGIAQNIVDAIAEAGNSAFRYFHDTGFSTVEEAVDGHKDTAYELWLEDAPKNVRVNLTSYTRFLAEWPAIRARALSSLASENFRIAASRERHAQDEHRAGRMTDAEYLVIREELRSAYRFFLTQPNEP